MKRGLGRQEAQMLAYMQMRRRQTVRTGELLRPLRLTRSQERELFRRLARGGVIARVRPGLFVVPPRLSLGGSWTPDEALALDVLMQDRDARYQVCGPNAFNRYGFDTQVPTRLYVYNNRISGQRAVGSVAFTLIKVRDQRLGDTDVVRSAEGIVTPYSSRVRTLVDAVYDWARFGSLPRAYEWIRSELAAGRLRLGELARVTLRYGDVGTIRRLGALLEREGAREAILRQLDRRLRPSTGLIPWIPTRPKRGKIDRRWGIVWNDV